MKFIVDDYKNIWQYFWTQQLVYVTEEHSFYMESAINKTDIELIVNKVSLAVVDSMVVSVSGFCGFDESMKSNHQFPKYKKGVLCVEYSLSHGFCKSPQKSDRLKS